MLTAIRDAESRVMFRGYNPLSYKLFVWTLSAVLCGIAGALYVPQVGIINPSEMSPAQLDRDRDLGRGRRARHAGRRVARRVRSSTARRAGSPRPSRAWLFVLGALFIVVALFLPGGVVELFAGLARGRGCAAQGVCRRHGAEEPARSQVAPRQHDADPETLPPTLPQTTPAAVSEEQRRDTPMLLGRRRHRQLRRLSRRSTT